METTLNRLISMNIELEGLLRVAANRQSQQALEAAKEKFGKVFAVLLILFGVNMLWQAFCRFLRHMVGSDFYYKYISGFMNTVSSDVPRMIIAFLIILFGIKLIWGKKEELDRLEKTEEMQQQAEPYQTQDDGNHFGQ